jgi:transcriptional regulator with XRE-family HTH domain
MSLGKQIRAARMLVGWDAEDLAAKAEVTRETIFNIERGVFRPRTNTLERIVRAFRDVGVEFIGERGVELRDDTVRKIEGTDCYAQLLDEVYYQLCEGDEFLVAWADETLSPPAVHSAYRRIIKKGITYRKFIQHGNTFICGPLSWYRYIPRRYYQNATAVFYQDKSAYLTEDFRKVIILKDAALTRANKKFFEMIWSTSSQPSRTTTKETY